MSEDKSLKAVLDSKGVVSLVENGKHVNPDYRRLTGDERILAKSYSLMKKSPASFSFNWNMGQAGVEDERFLRLAASLGLLFDERGKNIRLRDGVQDLELYGKWEDEMARFSLSVEKSEGKKISQFLNSMVIIDDELIETYENDLSSLKEIDGEKIKKGNLNLFFSILLSRHDGLKIRLEGFESVYKRPRSAKNALLFKEIDEYGYLHVLPEISVEGFTPGSIMANGITRSAILNEEERTLEIRDIVFSSDPVELFRSLLGKSAKNSVYEENGHFIIDGSFAESFIGKNFQNLISNFALYQANVISKYKIRYSRPKVHFTFSSGIDFLAAVGDVDIEGYTMSLDDFLTSYKNNGGYVLLEDGSKAFVDSIFMKRLERLVKKKGGKNEISAYDIPYIESLEDFEVSGEEKNKIRTFYKEINTISDKKDTSKIKSSKLRDYQKDGLKWLKYLHDKGMGGCLADEMGLGKTVQIIALLNEVSAKRTDKPSLIVAPKSIIYNWLSEINKFGIDLKPFVYYGTERNAEELKNLKGSIIISSYATIRNDIEKIQSLELDYLILDESQNIKHFNTRTAQAVLNLKSEHRIAVSGTPIENDLGELFSLFRFINPAVFPSLTQFNNDYVKPIAGEDKDALSDLRMKIYPFILRRLKKDVLKDLPEKSEQTAFVEMQDQHFSFYESRRKELKELVSSKIKTDGVQNSAFIILQALTELRQIASLPEGKMESSVTSSKREYLKEVLPEITSSGHKVLIFTSFLDTVEALGEDMEEMGIGYLSMTGATSKREALVNRFQTDESVKVFIMTLKTGGVGLNLTAADYVFIFDPWWNAAAEDQAINRTHRIGQKNSVFCYRLIAKNTIEEKILELQEKKRELSSKLITSDGAALKSLTEEEIENLLG